MTKAEAIERILQRAVIYANQDERKPPWGDVFHLPSRPDSLALEYDSHLIRGAIAGARKYQRETRTEQEILNSFKRIMEDAIHRAVHEDMRATGFLIADGLRGMLREGNGAN